MAQLVKTPPQCGRPAFDPWVGKIPWRRERLPTLVFWPGQFHGLYSPRGLKESDMTESVSLSLSCSFLHVSYSWISLTLWECGFMFFIKFEKLPIII